MRIFALIVDDIVRNLIIPGQADVAVWPYVDTEGRECAIGWGYGEGEFVPPPAPEPEPEPEPEVPPENVPVQQQLAEALAELGNVQARIISIQASLG